jgi:hypothetical protein
VKEDETGKIFQWLQQKAARRAVHDFRHHDDQPDYKTSNEYQSIDQWRS